MTEHKFDLYWKHSDFSYHARVITPASHHSIGVFCFHVIVLSVRPCWNPSVAHFLYVISRYISHSCRGFLHKPVFDEKWNQRTRRKIHDWDWEIADIRIAGLRCVNASLVFSKRSYLEPIHSSTAMSFNRAKRSFWISPHVLDINMSAIRPLGIQHGRSIVICTPLFISFAARVFQSWTFFCEDSGDDDRGIRFWWYFQFRCHCSRGHVVSVHCVPHRHDTPLDELAGNNSNHRAVFK